MKQLVTQAIVLSRTDYGEADRILTLLTPDQGKLSLLAKGVRRVKSKLAGGIELFSVSTITFIRGRGEVGTLVSARLDKYCKHIVEDLDRTMLGYELIKTLHKNTEDEPGLEYFALLQQTFMDLDDGDIPSQLIRFWFAAQLLKIEGNAPNLVTDSAGHKLTPEHGYDFNIEKMCFETKQLEVSHFTANHIKFLRLTFSADSSRLLSQVKGHDDLLRDLQPTVQLLASQYLGR